LALGGIEIQIRLLRNIVFLLFLKEITL